jgi:formate hydrogenlyase subunit 3/multisubunit Na+/H+ antiporter MnhD subunit
LSPRSAAPARLTFGSARSDVSRFLIVLGLIILAIGLLWPVLARLGLGRLPGDIVVQRDSFTFYFPLVTCIVISVLLSAVLWLLNR